MVLESLGHSLSESDIRHRCGHTVVGMRLNQIAKGLADIPVVVEYKDVWGPADLIDAARLGTNPIVGLDLRMVDGIFAFHAVVIVGVAAEQVRVHDPRYPKGPRSIGRNAFEAAWRAADREAVVILPEPMSLAI
jgi:uncharacterized protein YvpB